MRLLLEGFLLLEKYESLSKRECGNGVLLQRFNKIEEEFRKFFQNMEELFLFYNGVEFFVMENLLLCFNSDLFSLVVEDGFFFV